MNETVEDEHWTAAVLAAAATADGDTSGDRQDSGYGGRRRSSITSSAASGRGRPEEKADLDDSRDSTSARLRSSSLETRSVGAYYKHLDRFKVERTGSWVDLNEEPATRRQLPVILKPLKLLRPRSRMAKPKWVYGNPWASAGPKVVRDADREREDLFDGVTPLLRAPRANMNDVFMPAGQRSRPDRAGDKRVIRSQQTRRVWRPPAVEEAVAAAQVHNGQTIRKSRRTTLLKPLPSAAKRKSMASTRGNREVSDDERSLEESGLLNVANMSRRESLPSTREKRSAVGGGEAEVMTIHHEEVPPEEGGDDDEGADGVTHEAILKGLREHEKKTTRQGEGRKSREKERTKVKLEEKVKSGTKRTRVREEKGSRNSVSPVKKKGNNVPNSRLYRRVKSESQKEDNKGKVSSVDEDAERKRRQNEARRKRLDAFKRRNAAAAAAAAAAAKKKNEPEANSNSKTDAKSNKPKPQPQPQPQPSRKKDDKRRRKKGDEGLHVPAVKDEAEEVRRRQVEGDQSEMGLDEAAEVIENAFLEFLQDEEAGEEQTTMPKVKIPTMLFDYSEELAADILAAALLDTPATATNERTLEAIVEEAVDDALGAPTFDAAVDDYVARVETRRHQLNDTNEQTSVREAFEGYNLRPKYNFGDLPHPASVKPEIDGFSAKSPSPYPPPPTSSRTTSAKTFAEKKRILRELRLKRRPLTPRVHEQ